MREVEDIPVEGDKPSQQALILSCGELPADTQLSGITVAPMEV